MSISVGPESISKVRLGTTEAKKVYLGTTEVWSSFGPMGMDKSGTQSIPASQSGGMKLTGFVSRSGFAGPTGDALVATGTAQANVTASLQLTANSSFPPTLHVRKNGTSVASAQVPSFQSVANISTSIALVSGDVLELWVVTVFGGGVTVQTGSTYLYFTI